MNLSLFFSKVDTSLAANKILNIFKVLSLVIYFLFFLFASFDLANAFYSYNSINPQGLTIPIIQVLRFGLILSLTFFVGFKKLSVFAWVLLPVFVLEMFLGNIFLVLGFLEVLLLLKVQKAIDFLNK